MSAATDIDDQHARNRTLALNDAISHLRRAAYAAAAADVDERDQCRRASTLQNASTRMLAILAELEALQ